MPLSRHVFRAPTRFYKTGIVFLAYLNGLQDHFVMVGGQQSARSLLHLAELFRLADQARVLADPELAAKRMSAVLAVGGIALTQRIVRDASPASRSTSPRCASSSVSARRSTPAFAMASRRSAHGATRWRRSASAQAARIVHDSGVRVTGLCRGGMFPAADRAGRLAAIDDNRRAIDEAAALGADCLVLVVGGLPQGSRDIGAARAMVAEGIAARPAACPRARRCRSRSSRCIRCMPPTAPA